MQGSHAAPMEVLRGRDTHLAQFFKQKALDICVYHDVPPVWALALLNSAQIQCRGRKGAPMEVSGGRHTHLAQHPQQEALDL